MTGVIIAMKEEARAILDLYELEEVEAMGRVFFTERKDPEDRERLLFIVSGVGKVNAQVAASLLILLGCNRIVNVGTCGCTSDKYKIGDLVIPNTFFDGDFDLTAMDKTTKDPANVNSIEFEGNRIPCYSYSTFITDKRAEDGIIDMEAYGIVAEAKAFQGQCEVIVIKIVSDGGNVDEFENNVMVVMKPHMKEIQKLLEGRE